MLHSKMGLEMRMRDALDGMEQLASMYAYGRLPADLEIVDCDAPIPVKQLPVPSRPAAQILQFPTLTHPVNFDIPPKIMAKHNKITML